MDENHEEDDEEGYDQPAREAVGEFEIVVSLESEAWVGDDYDSQEKGHNNVCEDDWRHRKWSCDAFAGREVLSRELANEAQVPDEGGNTASAMYAAIMVHLGCYTAHPKWCGSWYRAYREEDGVHDQRLSRKTACKQIGCCSIDEREKFSTCNQHIDEDSDVGEKDESEEPTVDVEECIPNRCNHSPLGTLCLKVIAVLVLYHQLGDIFDDALLDACEAGFAWALWDAHRCWRPRDDDLLDLLNLRHDASIAVLAADTEGQC